MASPRPRFEVADVVRLHGEAFRLAHPPSAAGERVLSNIAACRSAALGGHVDECDTCDHVRISYNSCRDRHCPKCQAPRRAEWLAQRLERLLPVPYFHVVFTIPNALKPLVLGNKKTLYTILFRAASKTLLQIAQDPKHLGAQIGVSAVLHTWGQNLLLHPHLHCVVTGGGLAPDGRRWIHARERYLLPVGVLGQVFRGKFLHALHRAWKAGDLQLAGPTAELGNPAAWSAFKDDLYRQNWVVYAKAPFGGPKQVFRYLGRYTHRVAISNHRILNLTDEHVSFTAKDYRQGGRKKTLKLRPCAFLRRFLLHVLPRGFVRIRHYGLHAGRNLDTKLATARELLEPHLLPPAPRPAAPAPSTPWWDRFLERTGIDIMACPHCAGRLRPRQSLPPARGSPAFTAPPRASPLAA